MSLLTVQAAQERILRYFDPVESEALPLSQCAGRVLASDILSSDLPIFDNSSVDGFAVIAAELNDASPNSPITLRVVADIPAGFALEVHLLSGRSCANYDRRTFTKGRRFGDHGRRHRF